MRALRRAWALDEMEDTTAPSTPSRMSPVAAAQNALDLLYTLALQASVPDSHTGAHMWQAAVLLAKFRLLQTSVALLHQVVTTATPMGAASTTPADAFHTALMHQAGQYATFLSQVLEEVVARGHAMKVVELGGASLLIAWRGKEHEDRHTRIPVLALDDTLHSHDLEAHSHIGLLRHGVPPVLVSPLARDVLPLAQQAYRQDVLLRVREPLDALALHRLHRFAEAVRPPFTAHYVFLDPLYTLHGASDARGNARAPLAALEVQGEPRPHVAVQDDRRMQRQSGKEVRGVHQVGRQHGQSRRDSARSVPGGRGDAQRRPQ